MDYRLFRLCDRRSIERFHSVVIEHAPLAWPGLFSAVDVN